MTIARGSALRSPATSKEINHDGQGSRRARPCGGDQFGPRGGRRHAGHDHGTKAKKVKKSKPKKAAIEFTLRRETV